MKRHIKISSSGEKTKKIKCPAGQKSDGTKCVPMKSSEKINRKKAAKHAVKTKKAQAGKQKLAVKAMKKAMKKRKQRGL